VELERAARHQPARPAPLFRGEPPLPQRRPRAWTPSARPDAGSIATPCPSWASCGADAVWKNVFTTDTASSRRSTSRRCSVCSRRRRRGARAGLRGRRQDLAKTERFWRARMPTCQTSTPRGATRTWPTPRSNISSEATSSRISSRARTAGEPGRRSRATSPTATSSGPSSRIR
jgi:hypothetical protein